MRRLIVGTLAVVLVAAPVRADDEVVWRWTPADAVERALGRSDELRVPLPSELTPGSCAAVVIGLADADADAWVRLRFPSTKRPAARVRRVAVSSTSSLRLPLRYFREATHVVTDWEDVRSLTLSGDGVSVTAVELVRVAGRDAGLDAGELAQDAFDDATPWRTIGDLEVLVPDGLLDPDLLRRDLLAVQRGLESDLGSSARPLGRRTPRLVLFPDRASYDRFWGRFGARLGARDFRPPLSGFATLALATTWLPEAPEEVPVRVLHEAAHAWIEARVGLANRGDWLQEGLAERHTWPASRGLGPVATIRSGFAHADERTPLAELTGGRPLAPGEYWQARTLVDWLLAVPERRRVLHALVQASLDAGTTKLETLLSDVPDLGSVDDVERAWLAWGRRRHRVEEDE